MIILWICAALILVYGGLSLYGFRIAFCADRRPKERQPTPFDEEIRAGLAWYRAQPVQEVSIRSREGLRLKGRYLPCPGSDKTILLVHGHRSVSPENDFCCALRLYHEQMGMNLLLIDQRAQHGSEGKYLTFGVLEQLDVVDWALWLEEAHHPQVLLLDGMSMGAATVLMALAHRLPPCVRGVIADSGYTTAGEILSHAAKSRYGVPGGLVVPCLKLLFRLATGHSLAEADALRGIAKAQMPVLLLHGEGDEVVPWEMGRRLAAASPRAKLVTVAGAGHGLSFLVDREKCTKALDKFIQTVLQ